MRKEVTNGTSKKTGNPVKRATGMTLYKKLII